MDGIELRHRREELGLSQSQFSALIGVPANTIARWERGTLRIAHPVLLQLALDQIEHNRTTESSRL